METPHILFLDLFEDILNTENQDVLREKFTCTINYLIEVKGYSNATIEKILKLFYGEGMKEISQRHIQTHHQLKNTKDPLIESINENIELSLVDAASLSGITRQTIAKEKSIISANGKVHAKSFAIWLKDYYRGGKYYEGFKSNWAGRKPSNE